MEANPRSTPTKITKPGPSWPNRLDLETSLARAQGRKSRQPVANPGNVKARGIFERFDIFIPNWDVEFDRDAAHRPQPLFCLGQLAPAESEAASAQIASDSAGASWPRQKRGWGRWAAALLKTIARGGCSPPTPTPLLSRPACSRGVRGCLYPDGLLVSLEPKTSPFNNHPKEAASDSAGASWPRQKRGWGRAAAHRPQPLFCLGQLAPAELEAARSIGDNLPLGWLLKGEVLGSRLTNNLSGQRQPLTPREQAGLDRRGVGVGLQPC
ncbi:hypothetical protein V6N11_017712 [Hibiscus sabdariffa]|uniref:Uncharacterized protein n=1 Tax=Hibiscus sabdariffa TaxID=183260 RepID=A0ABR2TYV0_9ROSI